MHLSGVIAVFAVALGGTTAPAHFRQIADTAFHVTVARPAFARKPLRVMFDEAHHNFHTPRGSYRPFVELLERDGCIVTAGSQDLTRSYLTNFDLVVIANAVGDDLAAGTAASVIRPAFTRKEVEAVHGWVHAGGRLLLIAGHTPFGEAAAVLARRFGVDMGRGYALDRTLMLAGQESPFVMEFKRGSGTLGHHPIMQGRDPSEQIMRVIAFTGQSLRGPKASTPLLRLSRDAFDLPSSAQAAPEDVERIRRQALPAADRSVVVALVVGQGRVVVVGEPGMLTAEIIIEPDREPQRIGMNVAATDNAQFALNIIRWLAGVLPEGRSQAGNAGLTKSAGGSVAKTAVMPANPAQVTSGIPDFSGTWRLAAQSTEAWRGRGAIGNHEEPVRIVQTPTQLAIEVQSSDPAGFFRYELTGNRHQRARPASGELWSASVWDGKRLVTTGRRLFTTSEGPKPFEFAETRQLLDGGRRMQVELRIKMWPADLVRSSGYVRDP
jgi:hypothetical protein